MKIMFVRHGFSVVRIEGELVHEDGGLAFVKYIGGQRLTNVVNDAVFAVKIEDGKLKNGVWHDPVWEVVVRNNVPGGDALVVRTPYGVMAVENGRLVRR